MKKIIYILIAAFTIVACKKDEVKDYASLTGTITNSKQDSIMVLNPIDRDFKKVISLDEKGDFSDTLKVESGEYLLFIGDKYLPMYLKNGYVIDVSVDAENYLETIKYSGKGAEASNFIAKTASLSMEAFKEDIMGLEPDAFDAKIKKYSDDVLALLNSTPNLDSAFVAKQKNEIKMSQSGLKRMYDEKRAMLAELSPGKPSPKFSNYENYAGGETSLDDLKGKYVYIDLWATWCGPCIAEIPSLKKLEKEYHEKNITFVSISLDEKPKYETWRQMVKDKELGGVQLYFKGDESFPSAYKVQGIPRFILIDPQGNIVSADAPRPSDPKLVKLFNDLNI